VSERAREREGESEYKKKRGLYMEEDLALRGVEQAPVALVSDLFDFVCVWFV